MKNVNLLNIYFVYALYCCLYQNIAKILKLTHNTDLESSSEGHIKFSRIITEAFRSLFVGYNFLIQHNFLITDACKIKNINYLG